MRQFCSQRVFFEPPMAEFGTQEPVIPDPHHLLLLAIARAVAPPVLHMRSTLQPMRVIVIQPGRCDNVLDDLSEPNLLPLPQAATSFPQMDSHFRQRIVEGEILSDENGALFEKVGQQVRPIHQLASGPSGELIELMPVNPGRLRLLSAPVGPKVISSQTNDVPSVSPQNATQIGSGSSFVALGTTAHDSNPTHRKLFADPGQWRVVWWGEFKEILAKQLAHPERLRDNYRLPCYVQVFETTRAVKIEELAAAYAREHENQTSLYFLTDEIAAKLELNTLLPTVPPRPLHEERTPHTLMPHDRVFRLLVANDPTVDIASLKVSSEPANMKQAVVTEAKSVIDRQPTKVILKEEIPRSFVKEGEFKISREEAIYDINLKPSPGTLIRRVARRLQVFKRRNELRKWQALLAGRELDEQLWAVRPPTDLFSSPTVREWVTRTLTLAGYNVSKMISEWEVFWRRKQL
ncbi:MAG TPA: hypothetical protein VIG25_04825 [Pyrinomonadaceae bacterium]